MLTKFDMHLSAFVVVVDFRVRLSIFLCGLNFFLLPTIRKHGAFFFANTDVSNRLDGGFI